MKLIEMGELTEEIIDSVVEWSKDGTSNGDILGACAATEPYISHYFKCETGDGKRFVYFGSPAAFESFKIKSVQ